MSRARTKTATETSTESKCKEEKPSKQRWIVGKCQSECSPLTNQRRHLKLWRGGQQQNRAGLSTQSKTSEGPEEEQKVLDRSRSRSVRLPQPFQGLCLQRRKIHSKFTGKKLRAAVCAMKKGKAAGVDDIPAELVQAGGETMMDTLTILCNKIPHHHTSKTSSSFSALPKLRRHHSH